MADKHTPGPWRIAGEHKARRVIKNAQDESVVIIESWTTEPDARLIAAAPSMLTALQTILRMHAVPDGQGGVLYKDRIEAMACARAAIDKAEGK